MARKKLIHSAFMNSLPEELTTLPRRLKYPEHFQSNDDSPDETNEQDSSPLQSISVQSLQKYHRSQSREFDLATRQFIKKSKSVSKKDVKDFNKMRSDLKSLLERQQKDEMVDMKRILDVDEDALREKQEQLKEQKRLKAQKKREKQLQEKKERERLIEEAANDPNSSRNMENSAIRNILTEKQQVLKEITADGHCLYRAVADQFTQRGIPPQIKLDHDSNPLTYEHMRRTAAEYMREHKDDFFPFLGLEDDSQYEDYVQKVESSAEWGGQVELQALAKATGVNIRVIQATQPNEILIEGATTESATPQEIHLTYHKHFYALGEHYNSVHGA